MSDLVKRLRGIRSDLLNEAADRIEELEGQVEEFDTILDIFNRREGRKKYLEYWRKKNGKSDLSHPDADEVYKDFFEQLQHEVDLRETIENLMHENAKLRLKMSYMKNSDLFMGDEEGCW